MLDAMYSLICLLNGNSSLHEALRVFFLPIKNDDARLDFYTMYKKEATEYDTDYVKKYDEDLNTTLIFVRHLTRLSLSPLTISVLVGWFIFRRQLSLRSRHPIKTRTRSERPVRSPPPRHPPHPQSIRHPRGKPHCPSHI